jgi:hypothetical protein
MNLWYFFLTKTKQIKTNKQTHTHSKSKRKVETYRTPKRKRNIELIYQILKKLATMNFTSSILLAVLVGVASGQRPQLLRVSRVFDTATGSSSSSASFFDQKIQS